ncbi:hypothetical protein [Synechococcus sp. UW179A]|uniref:hypothetical protein n=1 Tax=Synechococcus sp. UW179A TaxID=2575510 RepID=UPI00148270A5|nr:hypothetical protein [Synechococcus sp. UW179A]
MASPLSASASEWITFDKATDTAYYQVRHERRIENISYIETRLITNGHHISIADSDYQANCKDGIVIGKYGKNHLDAYGTWISTETGRPSSIYIQKLYDFACE